MTAPAGGSPAAAVGRWSADARARSSAPPSELWSLIGEAARWREWSFLTRSELVGAGRPDPDGVGAVRRFTRYGIGSREQVVAWDPPHHLAYTILSGFPVRHHRADVTLMPDGEGTVIGWSATFDPMVPGTGRIMVAVVRRLMHGFATSVAAYAGGAGHPGARRGSG